MADGPPVRTSPGSSLVLSGGGSRGLAHAGALEAVDSLGYRPNLVVGTSMGALVGALYAAGYTPEEIQDEVVAVDWGETFTPAPLVVGPDRIARYPILIIDRDPDPLRFSRGFVPQWRVNRKIMQLLFEAGVRSRGDFDRLARRYRAVAADLTDGEQVVLREGDLARAVRASIAVPGFLAPVQIDGRFLVDGGIADNLPVGVARDLSGEPVIAVDVRIPPEEIDARGPLQVANRAIDLMMRNARQDTVPPEFLVQPAIPASVTGFVFPTDPEALFELGRESIRQNVAAYSDEPADVPALPPAPAAFGGLRVEAPDSASAALVRRVFRGIVPGPYDPDRILVAIDRLYTTGFFEAVWPRIEPGDTGERPELVVRVEGPPKISVAAALGYDSDRGGRFWSALQRSITLFGAPAFATVAGSLTPIQQWAEISARALLPAWPLLGWNGGAYVRETDVRQFGPEGRSDLEVVRAGGWLGLEVQQSLSARIATLALKAERIDPEEGSDGFSAGPLLRLAVPAAKQPIVGVQPELELEARWGEFQYQRGEIRASQGVQLGGFRAAVVGDLVVTHDAPLDVQPALGDQHAMPGYRWGEARGPVRGLAGFDLAWPIPFQGYLRGRVRAGAVTDHLADLDDRGAWIAGGEIGLIWRTPFGSLGLALSRAEGGEQNLVLDVGQAF